MKVAYLVNGYPRTSHSFIRREIRALESLGVEVLRFSQRPLNEPLVTEADLREQARTRVILAEGPLRHAWAVAAAALRNPLAFARALGAALDLGRTSDRGVLRHLAYLAEAAVLWRWLRGTGVAHLHAHFGDNSPAVALLCRALGGPSFSFTVHGQDEYDNFRKKAARAAFVVAISSFGRSQLYRRLDHREWPKVQVVRCGLDEDLLARPAAPAPPARRLACVARLTPEKGHLLLLEAVRRLAAEGERFELLLAGDGPLRPVVEEEVRRLGLERHVLLGGWMSGEQVREAILGARALLLPSFSEGLPVVVMEALALRRPAACSAIAGIPELVRPGETGWLFPAGSVDGLVAAIREVLACPPERLEAMGRAGAALVAAQHDARAEAARLLRLFQAAAGEVVPLHGTVNHPDATAARAAAGASLPRDRVPAGSAERHRGRANEASQPS